MMQRVHNRPQSPLPLSSLPSRKGSSQTSLDHHSSRLKIIASHLHTNMKSALFAAFSALAVQTVQAHATFQQLWVDGVDYISPFHFLILVAVADKVITVPSV